MWGGWGRPVTVVWVMFKALKHKTVTTGKNGNVKRRENSVSKWRKAQCSLSLVNLLDLVSDGMSVHNRTKQPQHMWHPSLCAHPSCPKTDFTRDGKEESSLFRNVSESGVILWMVFEGQRPKTSHELWLLFLLCLLLICVILGLYIWNTICTNTDHISYFHPSG